MIYASIADSRLKVPVLPALAGAFLVFLVLVMIFGQWVLPHDPQKLHVLRILQAPGDLHPLGTDDVGRDVLSRVMDGTLASVLGPFLVAVLSTAIGTVFGVLAGYRGGAIDAAVMRCADLLYSIPGLLVAIIAVGMFGGGYAVAIAVLALFTAPYQARIIRSAAAEQASRPYVEAAKLSGRSQLWIMANHLTPNVLPVVLASAFVEFANALVAFSGLSFLGLGSGPTGTDWGRMLSEARSYILDNPAWSLAPAILIIATAVAMNIVGNHIFERFSAGKSLRGAGDE